MDADNSKLAALSKKDRRKQRQIAENTPDQPKVTDAAKDAEEAFSVKMPTVYFSTLVRRQLGDAVLPPPTCEAIKLKELESIKEAKKFLIANNVLAGKGVVISREPQWEAFEYASLEESQTIVSAVREGKSYHTDMRESLRQLKAHLDTQGKNGDEYGAYPDTRSLDAHKAFTARVEQWQRYKSSAETVAAACTDVTNLLGSAEVFGRFAACLLRRALEGCEAAHNRVIATFENTSNPAQMKALIEALHTNTHLRRMNELRQQMHSAQSRAEESLESLSKAEKDLKAALAERDALETKISEEAAEMEQKQQSEWLRMQTDYAKCEQSCDFTKEVMQAVAKHKHEHEVRRDKVESDLHAGLDLLTKKHQVQFARVTAEGIVLAKQIQAEMNKTRAELCTLERIAETSGFAAARTSADVAVRELRQGELTLSNLMEELQHHIGTDWRDSIEGDQVIEFDGSSHWEASSRATSIFDSPEKLSQHPDDADDKGARGNSGHSSANSRVWGHSGAF